jgi:hypothetical protein
MMIIMITLKEKGEHKEGKNRSLTVILQERWKPSKGNWKKLHNEVLRTHKACSSPHAVQ